MPSPPNDGIPPRTDPTLPESDHYRPEWGREEIDFWDSIPVNNYLTPDELDEAQEYFDQGWIVMNDPLSRAIERDNYFQFMDMPPSRFDWEAYRNYLRQVGTPG